MTKRIIPAISIITVITIALIVAILLPSSAAAVPQPPHVFRGAVTVGGSAAADGLTVTAAIAGASFLYSVSAQTSSGRYGDDLNFKVPADDPDTSTKEGGVNGNAVVFYVEGVQAGTSTFTIGDVTELALSITALPTLTAPTNVQRTTPDSDNTPTFTWNAVTSAVSYEVRIVGVTNFTNIGNVTTYTFTTIADGSYAFEVRGVDAQGTPGASSTLYAFTIATAPSAPAAGGAGGGGGGLAGITSVLESVTEAGRFTEDVIARSEDNNVELYIPKNTIGKNRVGSLLSSVSIKEMEVPSEPPAYFKIIGRVYEIGPAGATFDPPITLTFKYDVSLLPEGVAEKNLVVATWDRSEWAEVASTVYPETDTITTRVSHFSVFAVLAHTRPASFTVADLSVTPTEVDFGKGVSISILVTNTGDLGGSYEVSLKIDNAVVQTKEVTLSGGDSETIIFSLTTDTAGEHRVNVNGLSGTFVVKPATPLSSPAPTVTPTPPPAPAPSPRPTPAPPPAPAPTPAPTPSLPPAPAPTPAPALATPMNWWLIGAGSIIIIGAAIWLVITRRRS